MKKKQTFTKKISVALFAALSLTATTAAYANNPPPRIKADAPNRYVVKKGDTLWDISGKFLESPWRWKEIWAANRQIRNPHLIYPKDILILCVIKGHKLVGIDTGEGCAGVEKALNTPASSDNTVVTAAGSIPVIPLSAIEAWLDRSIIVSPSDFNTTPYVLASKDKNIITGTGNKIYAKGVPLIVGQRYGIYREGEPYVDPASQRVVGLEVTQVAAGIVTSVAANGVSSIELKKSFGQGDSRVEVLKGIDLSIEKGEFCVLLGPSGSGKSTLLNIIGGIDRADSGQITIEGELMEKMTVKRLSQYRRKHLGYVFQMYNLIPNLTVRENIEVGAYLSDHALDVDELLDTLGLSAHQKKLPNQLSGGQQQRTAIGRAIIKNPDILLCDEPTGALDYKTSKEILKLIETVNQKYGNTVVMVTHNDAIKDMADRVVRIRDGMIRKNYLNDHKVSAQELDW